MARARELVFNPRPREQESPREITHDASRTDSQAISDRKPCARRHGFRPARGFRADGHPPRLPDQPLGDADLLSAALRLAGKARAEVRGVRRAVRQSHHAADGGAAGRSRHLCGALADPRARQGRPRRDRADRACRQDRKRDGAQGLEPHQDRAAEGPEDREPDRLLGRQHLRRPDRAQARPEERRLPGSAHGREQHDHRDVGEDRRRDGECRALQRDCRSRRPRGEDHELLRRSTRCRCSWRRRPTSCRKVPTRW